MTKSQFLSLYTGNMKPKLQPTYQQLRTVEKRVIKRDNGREDLRGSLLLKSSLILSMILRDSSVSCLQRKRSMLFSEGPHPSPTGSQTSTSSKTITGSGQLVLAKSIKVGRKRLKMFTTKF